MYHWLLLAIMSSILCTSSIAFATVKHSALRLVASNRKYSINRICTYRSITKLWDTKPYKGFGLDPKKPQKIIPDMRDTMKAREFSQLIKNGIPNGKKVFEEKLTFPTKFIMKVVGYNEGNYVQDILDITAKIVGCNATDIQHSLREGKPGSNTISLTISPVFQSADQLYSLYDVLGKDKRIKFIL